MQDIIEKENFLPKGYEDEIEKQLTSLEFPWFYNPGVSYSYEENSKFIANDRNIKDTDGFVNRLIIDNQKLSGYGDLIRPMIYFIEDRFSIPVKQIIRARAVMIYKNPTFGDFYNVPHVDDIAEHKTLIYYVNDSDGDTIIFQEKFDGKLNYEKKNIEKRVDPRKGKCVLFDGLRYHTGSVPKYNNRILINLNFI